jgi:hypothetical protein
MWHLEFNSIAKIEDEVIFYMGGNFSRASMQKNERGL